MGRMERVAGAAAVLAAAVCLLAPTPAGGPAPPGGRLLDPAATPSGLIAVPPPAGTPPPQAFPPTAVTLSWPDRLAVSPDGATLLVPLNLANAAAIVDLASKSVRYVTTGRYPYAAAVLADGKTGLVSN